MSSYSLQGEAVFSVGDFWIAEDRFRGLNGVTATDVGYSGGSTDNPTYHDTGDHSESVRLSFDQRIISYEELLDVFWQLYRGEPSDLRYENKIFFTTPEQRHAAQMSYKARHGDDAEMHPISIEPLQRFYAAEEYHQSYLAKLKGDR